MVYVQPADQNHGSTIWPIQAWELKDEIECKRLKWNICIFIWLRLNPPLNDDVISVLNNVWLVHNKTHTWSLRVREIHFIYFVPSNLLQNAGGGWGGGRKINVASVWHETTEFSCLGQIIFSQEMFFSHFFLDV